MGVYNTDGRVQSFRSHASFPSALDDDYLDDLSETENTGSIISSTDDESQPVNTFHRQNSADDSNEFLSVPDISPNPRLSPPVMRPQNSSGQQSHQEFLFENSPLLRKASISVSENPRTSPRIRPRTSRNQLRRRSLNELAVPERKPAQDPVTGNSTFGQSLFNSIAILLGVGILSEPFAFAAAGWLAGTGITICYGLLTCYTAKILARFIYSDSRLRTYSDCSRKAFGPRATAITSIFFFIELFTVSVVLVVLFSDSLHAVIPEYSPNTYKLLSLVILIPTAFFPLSVISFTSFLSVIATLYIGVVLIVNGLSKPEAPGSLYEFADTSFWPQSSQKLGLSFGIFMAGFAGHAVIPSIARDMREPEQFDYMINCAFAVTTIVYGAVGACGYLMFGTPVTDEISRDLLNTPGYNRFFTRTGMWMLVLSPITKFALSSRPLNIMLEIFLDIEPISTKDALHGASRRRPSAALSDRPNFEGVEPDRSNPGSRARTALLIVIERTSLVICVVFVAIAVPQFGLIMGLLGAFSAFTLCIIGPLAAQIAINGAHGWSGKSDCCLLALAIIMGGWGTTACVLDQLKRL